MAPRRRARLLSRGPVVLAVVTGSVLLLERWAGLDVAPWLLALLTMVFAVAVAALMIAGFLAFVTWWFFTRRPR